MEPPDSGPGQIGRYLLAGRLGSGGMGEVFLAWDEQLKRHVAIKRIHPDAGLSFKQQERFFREAQLTASVSHPNVVQIYDLLVEDEAIVMEYIEGRNLAERLAAERLETAQVLRLALEIARGLAAAHEAKLVHRDLKAANVLITRSEEHAKIVDFGLARPFVREPGDPGLTRKGMFVGTPHAMSPEQIGGEVVDERSDLFSFGSLFHEMLTGRPPFRGTDELDSLWKVVHEEPVHPLTARMDLPAEAAGLLLRLLEKNRNDRPGSAHEVIEVLQGLQMAPSVPRPVAAERNISDHPSSEETVLELPARRHRDRAPTDPAGKPPFWTRRRLLVTGAAMLLLLTVATVLFLRSARPLRIAVIMRYDPKDSELAPAATRIQSAAQDALASLEKITPIAPAEVSRAGSELPQIAKAVSADEFLRISVDREGGLALVTLERIAVGNEELIRSPPPFNVSLSRESRTDLIHIVTAQVQAGYSKVGHSHAEESEEYAPILLEIQDRIEAGQVEPKDLARLKEIMIANPKLAKAPWLAARIKHSQYLERREPADLEMASELVRNARRLSPDDRRPLRLQLQIALTRHRTDDAEEILEALQQLDPGDPDTLPLQAELAEQRNDLKKASKLLAEAVEQVPSWQNRYLLAGVEARLGRIDVARDQIAAIIVQSPGNVWALERSGDLEMSYGDPDTAERIYQSLLGSSAHERALSNLGTLRVLGEHFEEAAEIYRRVLAKHPKHVNALINLAEVETELKDKSGAAAHYHRALDLLKENEAKGELLPVEALLKAQCLARLGREQEAVAIVTELHAKADDDPQLLYQSAQVLSLAGKRASAIAEAKAALTKGFLPRWFTGSDFQWLREDPELRPWFPKTS